MLLKVDYYLMLLKEAAVHTLDLSWKKMDVNLMMMMMNVHCFVINHGLDDKQTSVALSFRTVITISHHRAFVSCHL